MKHLQYLLILLLSLALIVPVAAQDTETADWGDTGLVVDYPEDWDVSSSDTAPLILSDGNIQMYFYLEREARSSEQVLEDLASNSANSDFDFGDIEETDLFDGEALRQDFESETLTGFSLALEFDGQFLLIDSFVFDDRLSGSEEDDIIAVLETLREGGSSNNNNNNNSSSNEGFETAEWGDTGLAVDYPEDWDVSSSDTAPLILSDGNIQMYFYLEREARSSEQVLEDLVSNSANSDFDFGDIEETDLFGGDALRQDFESETLTGFSLALEYDDQLLLIDSFVFDDRLSGSEEDTIIAILETLRPADEDSNNNSNNNNSSGGDVVLQDAFGSADDAIAELEDLGLISGRGDVLFEEDMLTSAFNGTDISEEYEGGNIVMAALVSWRAVDDDEEYRICGLVSQASTDDLADDEGAVLVTGFDSDSNVVTFEVNLEDISASVFEAHEAEINIDQPQHILMIVQDGAVTVFVNGELTVDSWELSLTDTDDEVFAGYVLDLGCVMTGVWAYSFD